MDRKISTVVRKNLVVVKRQTGDQVVVVRPRPENQIPVVKKRETKKKQKVTTPQELPTQQGQVVQRVKQPYWQEKGWKASFWKGLLSSAKVYCGSYKTPYASFDGEIIGDEYFIFDISPQILQGPHKACFTPTNIPGKYRIHFNPHPADIDSGISCVERLIVESYTN